jgi:hypothetical protein
MKIPPYEVLLKFDQSPGLCTYDEIMDVKEWVTEFNKHLCIYKDVFGEPAGLSVRSKLDKLDWYEDFHTPNQGQDLS